jgi:tRNA A-37 threonylcarbamoyl transferase component Bud32
LQIDLVLAVKSSRIAEKFEIGDVIGEGSTSVALKAINKTVGRPVVLKVLRPSNYRQVQAAIARLGTLDDIPHLVAPIDSYEIETSSIAGDRTKLFCIVFPFIPATTFDDYIGRRAPVTPYFFEAFIRQVGGVLRALEARKMPHGDLHGANILVSSEDPNLEFTIIDPSPGLTGISPYRRRWSDFDWLKEHLSNALMVLQRHLPSISTQKHLGPRLFSVINRVLEAKSMSFREVLELLENNPRYSRWLKDREAFVASKFQQPKPLGLLRWEEIADPALAVELFEPFPELFKRVRGFGNALVVGARGSGKSTYLAALAYFPGAKRRLVEPKEVFGVLFSCRQGEFKQISSDFISFDPKSRLAVKHVLVLKIMRRLLATLSAASELGEVACAGELKSLYSFVRRYLSDDVSIPHVGSESAAAISNLAAGVVRWEELEVRRLFADSNFEHGKARPHLDESSLLEFCELVRSLFPGLATSQFYFLFDDAGHPNVPRDAQHVLNDLVTSSNAVYCVKLSAERYSYDLRDSAGRILEETHDFTSFDIATAYASEGGNDQSRRVNKEYFGQIMKKRLEYWRFPATDIAAYLGDQMKSPKEMIPVRELIRRLAEGRKDAYYCGWEVVWQLADKTPRNLIELVSEIFAHARVRPVDSRTTEEPPLPGVIAARVQDRAIRAVSNRRLRGLEFIPGEIVIREQTVPLGKHLYLCASSFGTVSYKYLTKHRGKGGERRIDERLALERNDTSMLRKDAQRVLESLVRYGIFDDSALNVAFDDGQKKPIYVFNRIFCPSFGISFRRDAHLRLSAQKLEMFLLQPARFVRSGTKFLSNQERDEGAQKFWVEEEGD